MTNESSDLIGQRKLRIEKVEKLKALGIDPYPAKSNRTNPITEIVNNFEKYENTNQVLDGRIGAIRGHGALMFLDLKDENGKIQVYVKQDEYKSRSENEHYLNFDELNLIDSGDFIEVTGTITKTQSGEMSILASNIRMLAKTLRPTPTELDDKEERFRRRYVDMNVHPEVRERMKRRALFWQAHRDFFNEKGFYEVNIPVLEHVPGGGDAVPFTTHMNALDQDFFLRISHELPLKRLIGGGFEKVYDIGARFRNEGLSDEHLPEHVAMEFYWAFADWRDGMKLIQDLFRYITEKVYNGKTQFKIRGFDIDFGKDWEIVDFNEIMQKNYGIADIYKITIEEVKELLNKHGIEFDRSVNIARGVDALWKKLRKNIGGPAFLINHPKYLSPLQKPSLENENMVERFQPIIAGSELGNGWSELNDPIDQYNRFIEQQKLRDSGDAEAQWLDIDYVEMLEYGMPPTFGYGHSERVFWFLEDVTAREGVPFPQLKMDVDNITKTIYPDAFELNTKAELKTSEVVKEQDFNNRIIIVVNNGIERWQQANAVAHVSAYLGNKLDEKFATGENFVTADGKNHPRNSQYPIVVMEANPGQMANLMEKVREAGVMYHGFIREMINTNNDEELTQILNSKSDQDIEYLGIGFYGSNEKVRELTKKFSLYK